MRPLFLIDYDIPAQMPEVPSSLPVMTSPMEQLPVELVDMIVSYLPLAHHQSLRLTSRQLHALTYETFTTKYFSRRTTTLGPPSLERLVNISCRNHLARSVTFLDIKLLNHEDYRNLQKISRVGIYPPPKRFQQVLSVRTEDISREALLFQYMQANDDPKDVTQSLSRALGRFCNIKSIRFRVNRLTLYGSPHILAEEEDYQHFLLACFKAVLNAIVKSGVQLHDFSLTKGTNKIRALTKSANLIHPAFNFSLPFLLSLKKAFTSLRSLSLSIHTDYNGNARIPGWQNGISSFISAASALEELTLCFKPRDGKPGFRADVLHSLASSLELPKLKRLQTYGCVVDAQDLIALTKTHSSTLRQLVINDSYMREGTWMSALQSFRESLSLEYLRLSCLQQSSSPRDIWWHGVKSRKTKQIMDTTDEAEGRSMHEMLTESINYLTLISTLTEPYLLPYSVLLAYPSSH